MTTLLKEVRESFRPVLTEMLGSEDEVEEALKLIRPCRSGHGDYQAAFVMGLAKKLDRPPRDVAEELVEWFTWNIT
jgi:arginyl-tRNA synthetase